MLPVPACRVPRGADQISPDGQVGGDTKLGHVFSKQSLRENSRGSLIYIKVDRSRAERPFPQVMRAPPPVHWHAEANSPAEWDKKERERSDRGLCTPAASA
jgi:hypothetical protein